MIRTRIRNTDFLSIKIEDPPDLFYVAKYFCTGTVGTWYLCYRYLSRGDQKIFSAIGGTGTHLVIESPSSHTIPVTQSQDIPVHDTGTCTRTEGLAGGCPEEGR